jgi:3D (Asp-Asp-Asp) domain-containing protein
MKIYFAKAGLIAMLLCSIFVNPVFAPIYTAPLVSPPQPPKTEPFKMIATAYSRSEEEGTADGITASGTIVRPGVVAVDPEVIPLGTEIFIEGLGVFTAEDTGGDIKGNRLDIYFESREEAFEFGIQSVNVFIKERK